MKKLLATTLGLMLCLALAIPAMADVSVTATIDKTKEIYIYEYVDITKCVDVCVDVDLSTQSAAEAKAMFNQVNAYSVDIEALCLEVNDVDSGMGGSILGNTGIVGVNQSAASLNNQGNVVALAVTDGKKAFGDAQSSVEQANVLDFHLEFLTISADLMDGSIKGNSGILGVNQAAGNLNNQANSVALAAGLGESAYVSLAEADLGQYNACTMVLDFASARIDVITDSINCNHGVVGFNQSAGNLNNQANVVSISFAH